MLQILWDTRGYFFWLIVVSVGCWALERLAPWRPSQRAWRDQFGQDLFWLVFNGHYAGVLLASVWTWLLEPLHTFVGAGSLPVIPAVRFLMHQPLWAQFVVFLLVKDLLEYFIHNLLHRVPWLWEFHKLHHSIRELDWIGNMRFHWMEIAVYHSLTYFPLFMLGVDARVILWIAIFTTLIGHLNHSNLHLDWGVFRYLLNSPRLHVWHHDAVQHQPHGQNFGVVFSLWDFLFGTVYFPAQGQPARLGFEGMEQFPERLLPRLIYPIGKR
ncbi:MAG: sterol desaturase family protein [Acidobacteria bacterium]|nr:sterol desaturase family protein [Acidobacteriota bacterium]MCI0620227.1 sterol desaturase family protein [Acidobacteriota bacterium]MCI0722921.1 sterol desaturase family protein [Acidobacteriota bacterium]